MLQNYNLIRSILSEPWLMSTSEAEKLAYLVYGVFNPSIAFEPLDRSDSEVSDVRDVSFGDSGSAAQRNVGVIRMTGTLTKYDSMCAYGMESYGRMIRDMDADESIDSILLNIDSGGGTFVGTGELGETIRSASKPVVAFVSDKACSGAYWIASCCREIVANSTTAEVGSIGVVCSIADMTEFYERKGIKLHDILPEQSKDKREESEQIKAGNFDLTRSRLGVLADKFHAVVRSGRPAVKDEQLTGKVYFAQDVLGTLVDRIGTFEQALERAASLAAESDKKQDQMSEQKFPALAVAAGVSAFESGDGTITLTAEMAQQVETSLAAVAELKKKTDELTAADARIQALESEISKRDTRIAELEQAPGDNGAAVVPQTDGTTETPEAATDFAGAYAAALEFINL